MGGKLPPTTKVAVVLPDGEGAGCCLPVFRSAVSVQEVPFQVSVSVTRVGPGIVPPVNAIAAVVVPEPPSQPRDVVKSATSVHALPSHSSLHW